MAEAMSEGSRKLRYAWIWFGAAILFFMIGLLAVVVEMGSPRNRARRALEESFTSQQRGDPAYKVISNFGTQACVLALTDLLQTRPTLASEWYGKAYKRMPELLQKRLHKPVDRLSILGSTITMLGSLGPASAYAAPALARVYQSDNTNVVEKKRDVLRALRKIGPSARAAIPQIISGLAAGPDQEVVAETLIVIDPHGDLVADALRELETQTRYANFASSNAARCLMVLDPSRSTIRPAFPSRWTAFLVIGLLRSEAHQTVPVVRPYLEDDSEVLRGLAATSLSLLGPAAAEALPDLQARLNDEWIGVRQAVTNAIRAIENGSGEITRLQAKQEPRSNIDGLISPPVHPPGQLEKSNVVN